MYRRGKPVLRVGVVPTSIVRNFSTGQAHIYMYKAFFCSGDSPIGDSMALA